MTTDPQSNPPPDDPHPHPPLPLAPPGTERLPDGSPSPFPRSPGVPRTRADVIPPRGPFPDTLPGIGPVVGTRTDAAARAAGLAAGPPVGAFGPVVKPPARARTPRGSARMRWLRRVVVVLLALVALYAFRGIWLGPLLARHFETQLSEALGADISIRVVEGNGFDSLRLVGVSTRRDGRLTPVRRLAARAMRLHYNLQDWLAGRDDWLRTLEVEGLELDIDLAGGPREIRRLEHVTLPVSLPEVHVVDGAIRIHNGNDELRMSRVAFDHMPAGPARAQLDLLAEDMSGWFDGRILPPGALRIEAVRVGDTIQFNRLEQRNASITQSLRITLDDDAGAVQIKGDVALAGGHAFADAVWSEEEIAPGRWQPVVRIARLHLDSIDQAALVQQPGFASWPLQAGWVSGEIDGEVWPRLMERTALSLRLGLQGARLDAAQLGLLSRLPADVREWVPREVLPESATINLELRDRRFEVREATLVTAGARWSFSGLGFAPATDVDSPATTASTDAAADGLVATVNQAGARLELRVPDVATLSRAFGPSRIPFEQLAGVQLDFAARVDPGGALALSARFRDAAGHEISGNGVLQPRGSPGQPQTRDGAIAATRAQPLAMDAWFARLRRGDAFLSGSVRLAGIDRVRDVMNAIGMDVAPIADVDGAISGAIELSNSLDEPALRVWIDGANWRRGDDQLGSFALDARVLRENGAGIIVVDRLDAVGIDRLPDGPLDPATGRPRLPLADPSVDRVRASGRAQLEPLLIEDSYLEAVIHDLSRYEWLARLIWPGTTPRLRGQVEASVLGNGEPDTWRGDVWLAARHLRLFDHDLGELTLDGVAAPHQLFVNRVSLDGPAGRMTLAGSVDWSGIRGTDRDTLGIALRAFAIERRDDRLALADPAQLRVHFTKARASGITFGNELRLAGTIGRINARGRLHLQNGESDFALGVRELRLPALRRLLEPDAPPLHVNEPIDRVDLVVSGPADNALWELRVATGALRVRESPLLVALREFGAGEGDAPPTTTDRSDPQLDGLIWITGTGSRALVRDARVRLFAVDPSGASQLLASATASGTLPLDPLSVLQSALANDNARWLDRLLASGSLALRLQLQCDDLLALHRLGARLPLPGGRLSVDCGVSGTWRQPGAALVATSPALDCAPIGAEQLAAIDRAAGTHFADVAARPASLVLGLDLRAAYGPRATPPDEPRTPGTLGELRLDELTLTGDEHIGRISLAGALHTRGSLVGALAGREPIDLIDARLHVRGALPSLARLPLPWGAQPAIDAGVEIDLQATSLMHHPRWNGFVVVRDGRLDAGGIMPPLERIEGRIDFAGEDVRVSDARLTAGSGLVEMAGTLLLAPDPERVRIHLRAVGRNVLVARDDSMNLRANLDLSVGGSFDAPVVSGRVAITRGEFHRPLDTFNLLQSISRAPAVAGGWRVPFVGDPRLDVQVTSLAAARIRTPNTIAEASASLRVLGTANEVRLDGRIDVARMYISLPATTLHIDSGGLVFHQSADSDRSGPPQIWLNGRSTVRGYRIVLAVSGPAGQPALELSSVPPLPADQLLVMLFTGDAPRAVDTLKGADLAGAEKVSVFIGPDVLRRVFGADPQVREQMLDRIDVQPDVDISESGESMFVVRFALAGNLVSRSDRVEVELSRDRYDDFNTGLTFTLRFR